jgi:L-iditol 2-dehydrogenase
MKLAESFPLSAPLSTPPSPPPPSTKRIHSIDPSRYVSTLFPLFLSLIPLQIGQRVAIEAGIMCRNCEYCLSHRYNLCKGMSFRSSAKTFPHADGTLQSHLNHPVSHLHPIPDHLSFQLAAMAEPLSVLLHATRRARLLANDHSINNPAKPTVAIFGAGTIGLLAAALVSSPLYPIQASRVVLLDIDAARLDHAAKNGFVRRQDTYLLPMTPRSVMATWTVEQKIQHATKTIAPALEKFGLSQGVDCVYECSGAEPCIQMGIFVSR